MKRLMRWSMAAGLAGLALGAAAAPPTAPATTARPSVPARPAAAGATAAPPGMVSTASLLASLRVDGRDGRLTLVGRTEKTLYFIEAGAAQGQMKTLPLERVEAARFDISYDRFEVTQAQRQRDWDRAIGILLPPLQPTFPYLDLPENNALQGVVDLGDAMMRAAEVVRRTSTATNAEATVAKKYESAYAVLRHASKARWSSSGKIATLKGIRCLMELDRARTAREDFARLDEPAVGDAAYGLYWLVAAELRMATNDYRGAMDAAVKSLCFENKDVDTFPDALLTSATCYEELQEWHRARDVYYEVARILPGTDWADAAAARLKFIMDKGLTKGQEKSPLENVFFGMKEDVNKLVTDLLKQRQLTGGKAPEADTGAADDEKESGAPAKEEATGAAARAAAP